MKLSDAILLGAAKRPHGREDYFPTLPDGQIGSCALGAAVDGVMPDFDPTTMGPWVTHLLQWQFGRALRAEHRDPSLPPAVTDCFPVESTIHHLNDHVGWSREQIAAWLRSIDL